MGRKKAEREIEGHTYNVTQMDAIHALKAQTYLAKVIAPVAERLTTMDFNSSVANLILELLPVLTEKMDDDKFHQFFINMCQEAFRDGERVNFNSSFTGNLKEAYLCFGFVIEVNFLDFIEGVLGTRLQELLGVFKTQVNGTKKTSAPKKKK